MSTVANTNPPAPTSGASTLSRILDEGYGPGAWHGADMKAALADVDPDLAFWRPAPGRHNIAEIAIHHAYYVHSVRERLGGRPPGAFAFEGDDWFDLPGTAKSLAWPELRAIVEKEQQELAALVNDIAAGRVRSDKTEKERLDLILGITCHAVYHAGQIQLIKRLHAK